ncbi:Putative mycotoxin biosynthesis protein UstYa [Septoria linicola]|uniref:Mycotoxin biosynthesis protein UstYa n=1 Tax=Septoria linicola TaxID=215465 RepID=A0A9Q9EK77_9PEZI|nr:Putative mycotoxin biosynthesis protein UstYa [Septoria linicola]
MSEKSYSDNSYLESVRSDEALLGLSHRQPKKSRWLVWSTYLASGLILLVLGSLAGRYTRRDTDQECAAQLSMYSPAIEAVEYIDFDFDDDFNVSSIYRGPPTPEREAAWLDMTYKHGVEIPEDKLEKLNRTEKDHMK